MRFFYVRLRTYAQYASMNEFTCSEHSVRIYVRKKNASLENSLYFEFIIKKCDNKRLFVCAVY